MSCAPRTGEDEILTGHYLWRLTLGLGNVSHGNWAAGLKSGSGPTFELCKTLRLPRILHLQVATETNVNK